MDLPFSIENILARPTYRPIAPAVYTVFHPYLLPSRNYPVNSTIGLPPFSTTRKRRKRYRTIFNETQIELLEELFRTTQYPDLYQRENVALKAGLQEERVEVWFKNRRARNRKLKKAAKNPSEKSDDENDAELEGSDNKKENEKENEKEATS